LAAAALVVGGLGVASAAVAGVQPPAARIEPALVPAAVTPSDAPLTAATIATAEKPEGFRYAVLRDGIVDSVSETLLYVKAHKAAQTSTAVPIPKDRALLARCVVSGKPEDLVRGTVLSVRYDPRGVVRPEIEIQAPSQLEILDGAKVLDRGGNKLYVRTADGVDRGFQIEGGVEGWASVVQNGKPADLKSGAIVRVVFDPSGREPLQITLRETPKAAEVPVRDKGCGCIVHGAGTLPSAGALLLGAGLVCVLWRRRRV